MILVYKPSEQNLKTYKTQTLSWGSFSVDLAARTNDNTRFFALALPFVWFVFSFYSHFIFIVVSLRIMLHA